MKFIRYKTKTNDTKYGVLEEGNLITEITNTPFESFTNTDITHLIDDVSILSVNQPPGIFNDLSLTYFSMLFDNSSFINSFSFI